MDFQKEASNLFLRYAHGEYSDKEVLKKDKKNINKRSRVLTKRSIASEYDRVEGIQEYINDLAEYEAWEESCDGHLLETNLDQLPEDVTLL